MDLFDYSFICNDLRGRHIPVHPMKVDTDWTFAVFMNSFWHIRYSIASGLFFPTTKRPNIELDQIESYNFNATKYSALRLLAMCAHLSHAVIHDMTIAWVFVRQINLVANLQLERMSHLPICLCRYILDRECSTI